MLKAPSLLAADEPPAFHIEQEHGQSPFFIICDHAGARIPRKLGSLGLTATDLQRHIAWDIGAAGVASKLAASLDAFAIFQTYSRLVIDCNRPLDSPSSIVTLSEETAIPGNQGVTPQEAGQREREIFRPYHDRILAELDSRESIGRRTILIAMHSFTPVFKSTVRSMHAGVLYNRDARLAHRLLVELRGDGNLIVGDNEPYRVSDATDYAIPVYGEQRNLLHVEMEIRQDLIVDDAGQTKWAQRMSSALRRAIEGLV